jgi:hypothetical protein
MVKATEIQVTHKLFTYKIHIDPQEINYHSSNIELSLKKKSCNEHIIKAAESKLKNYLSKEFLNLPAANSYLLIIDNIKKYDLYTSKRAAFFANFDAYFKTLKIEEQLSCKL